MIETVGRSRYGYGMSSVCVERRAAGGGEREETAQRIHEFTRMSRREMYRCMRVWFCRSLGRGESMYVSVDEAFFSEKKEVCC